MFEACCLLLGFSHPWSICLDFGSFFLLIWAPVIYG